MTNLSATLVDLEESLAADLGITDAARPRHYALRPVAALRAVLAEHAPEDEGPQYAPGTRLVCTGCLNAAGEYREYPCATVRAIGAALDHAVELEAPTADTHPRAGEHRNGCQGCEHDAAVIPGCWSEEDVAAWYALFTRPRATT